jgi:hypothetical protein
VPTTTTLSVAKTKRSLKARGEVPGPVGEEVAVALSRKRGGRFRRIAMKRAVLDADGEYRTRFRRPAPGRCRIKARFAGNERFAPSSAVKRFPC